MKIGIRQKLLFGLSGMLVIVAAISFVTIGQIDMLGKSLAIVLKENYQSVVASQDMKDALDTINSAELNSFLGNHDKDMQIVVNAHKSKFIKALDRELHLITLPGEQERADRIQLLSKEYFSILPRVMDTSMSEPVRRTLYVTKQVPVFSEIKKVAQEILDMNQANMITEKYATQNLAISARWRMLSVSLASVLFAILLSYQIHRWVFHPLRRLIETTEEIRRGNLEVVLQTAANDEVGQLSRSFNAMLIALRQNRNSDMANLIRSRKLTEDVFRVLPVPVAVLDSEGEVRVSTETAVQLFGLKPGVSARELPFPWISGLLDKSFATRRPASLDEKGYVQQFVSNKEYFFQPEAVPIISASEPESGDGGGTILIMTDMTQMHEQQEMKQGMLSTVSHQLKTPLTSLRMSIHLLLDEEVGALNTQQTELMVGAREDCERLVEMLDDLLDLNRIESGKAYLEPRSVQPSLLVRESMEPFLSEAKDRNVTITEAIADDLPDVFADPTGIRHVFANLLSNALRFTSPGGTVRAGAEKEGEFVRFFVEDTGSGIASEHMAHLFEQFFRAPGQDIRSGAGLGLSIVKELVEAQGGMVSSLSQPGKGSLFSFTLPVHKQQVSSGKLLINGRA